MRLLTLNGDDASMKSKAEVNAFLKQAGTTGGPFEMVVKYDPEGYAAYDGGTLFKMEQAMMAAAAPAAEADGPGEDKYGAAQSFSNKAGHAQAHRKMSAEDLYQRPSQARRFDVDVPTPLGMAFDGSPSTGYFITKVKPDSNAFATGQLKVDMRILSVNGADLEGIDKKSVTGFMKASDGVCKLQVQFDKDGAENFAKFKAERAGGKEPSPPAAPQPAAPAAPEGDVYTSSSAEEPKKESKKNGKKGGKKKGAAVVSVSVPTPLGMAFDGQADTGFYVKTCREGKNAAATGVIVEGQKILSVNGQKLDGLDKKTVTNLIKGSPGECALELRPDPKGFAAFNKVREDQKAAMGGGAPPQASAPAPPPRAEPVADHAYATIDPVDEPPAPKKKKKSNKGGSGKIDYAADQSWNVGAMGKGAVSALLGKPNNAPGSFVVRNSSQPGKLALSIKDVGGGIRAFLITVLPGGRYEVIGKQANSLPEAIEIFAAEVVTSKDTPGASFKLGPGAK